MTPNIQLVRTHPDAVLPVKGTSGAAGYDLTAVEPVVLHAGERMLVDTGWLIRISQGYEGQVRARSGLALKQGLTAGLWACF
jgi:dUTP pyrophosphatase